MGRWQEQARKRQVSGGGARAGTNRLACIGLAILAGLLIYAFSFTWRESYDFYSHAVPAQATLDNDYVENTRRHKGVTTTSYTVKYSYSTPAGTFTGSDTISDPPAPTMTVYYHSQRPGASKLEYLGHFHIVCGIMAVMILGFAVSLLMARVYHRRVQLAKQAGALEQAA